MLVADDVVINPAEAPMVPARVEKSLSEMGLTVKAADWGDSAPASGTDPKTRTIALQLVVAEDADADLPTAAYELQQIVGSMQEREAWIRRDPKVGGNFAGPLMYRIKRPRTGEEPQVTLSNFAGWQAGQSPDVTLTMVADFAGLSTEEAESETFSTTTARELIYTQPASRGTTRGLKRIRVTNNNSSGDLRGLIWGEECQDYKPGDPTAEPAYLAKDLTPKGGAKVKTFSGAEVVYHSALTSGWLTILSSEIADVGHMSHRGLRRMWMRVWDPNAKDGNVQLHLIWRALGATHWTEDNPITPVYLAGDYCLVDLGGAQPQTAVLGEERWEWKLAARALSGSGEIRIRDVYPFPTEQYVVLSEDVDAAADGEPTMFPGTVEDKSGVGTVSWSEPENAAAEDEASAGVTLGVGESSHYLYAHDLGFELPSDAVIQGIEPRGLIAGNLGVRELHARIVKGGVVKTSVDTADEEVLLPSASAPEWRSWGGPAQLFGQSWTLADIEDAGFGFVLALRGVLFAGPEEGEAEANVLALRVHYTTDSEKPRVCYAERAIELRSGGVFRQGADDDVWGEVVPIGFLPYAAPAGLEAMESRTIIVPSQGDLVSRADSGGANKTEAVEWMRDAFHNARGRK